MLPPAPRFPPPPLVKTPRVIFFDAAGTLFGLREPVGHTYARHAARHGVTADAGALDAGFRKAWREFPPPLHPVGRPPADDDRSWWAELVRRTFDHAAASSFPAPAIGPLFAEIYSYYAGAEAWKLHEDTRAALVELSPRFRLMVLSNFDRRLRGILDGLGIGGFFERVIVSSEVGAAKPHPRMFRAAREAAALPAEECLHVGDDERADSVGAQAAGLPCFLIQRPRVTLRTLAEKLRQG